MFQKRVTKTNNVNKPLIPLIFIEKEGLVRTREVPFPGSEK